MTDKSKEARTLYTLGELIEVRHGFAFESKYFALDGEHMLLTPANFNEPGGFRALGFQQKRYGATPPIGFVLSAGDLVTVMTEQAPGLLGATLKVPSEGSWLHNQRLGLVELKRPDLIARSFAYHLMNAPGVREQIAKTASGTKVRHTSPSGIHRVRVELPDLQGQRETAEILDCWDRSIAAMKQLSNGVDARFTGLARRLLQAGQTESLQWPVLPLGDLFGRVTRAVRAPMPSLTISAGRGFLNQSARFGAGRLAASTASYVALRRDEFAFNKGNSKTYSCGCVYRLRDHEQAAIPGVYIAFVAKRELCLPFWDHYFQADCLRPGLRRIINSGVRGDGLLNLSADDFFRIKVPLPPLEEQQELAAVLDAAATELQLLNDQLSALREQKQALLQRLIGGAEPAARIRS